MTNNIKLERKFLYAQIYISILYFILFFLFLYALGGFSGNIEDIFYFMLFLCPHLFILIIISILLHILRYREQVVIQLTIIWSFFFLAGTFWTAWFLIPLL